MAQRADLPGAPRVLLDGATTGSLAEDVAACLVARGRVPVLVAAEGFWRPAGERFTYGREDPQAFLESWLDHAALRREVLDREDDYLPALWDVARDRSARQERRLLPERSVRVVHGVFLQGLGLPAELTVHVALSPAALLRRGVPPWQLAAFAAYDEQVLPGEVADVLVRAEDPKRPAVRW